MNHKSALCRHVSALLAVSTLVLVPGCVSAPRPIAQLPVFPLEEYSALETSGTASLTGQAVMKTVGGDVKLGAGSQVVLQPVTSYSQSIVDAAKNGERINPEDIDPRLKSYLHVAQADAEGRFRFDGLPAGRFVVATSVTWGVVSGSSGVVQQQGGDIVKEIEIASGEQASLIMFR